MSTKQACTVGKMKSNDKFYVRIGRLASLDCTCLVSCCYRFGRRAAGRACGNNRYNRSWARNRSFYCILKTRIISCSRIAGFRWHLQHYASFDSSSEHKLCSHRDSGHHPRGHLWIGNVGARSSDGYEDSEDCKGSP